MTARVRMILVVTAVALCAVPAWADQATPARTSPTDKLTRPLTTVELKAPLGEVLEQLGQLAGVEIVADWNVLARAGINAQTPVVLKGSRVPTTDLLDMALAQVPATAPLAWFVDGDSVRVTARSELLRSGPAPAAAVKAGTTAPRAAPLRQNWEFDNIALSDAMEAFRQSAGANLYVNWRSLEQAGISKDTPVTLKVEGVSWKRAMGMILDELSANKSKLDSLYCILDDRVWMVATGSTLNTRTITRTFYIADMLTVVPQFTGPRLGIQTSGNNSSTTNNNALAPTALLTQEPTSGTDARKQNEERIIGFFKTAIGEEMWQPQGPGSISILNNQLVISQTRLGWHLLSRSMRSR